MPAHRGEGAILRPDWHAQDQAGTDLGDHPAPAPIAPDSAGPAGSTATRTAPHLTAVALRQWEAGVPVRAQAVEVDEQASPRGRRAATPRWTRRGSHHRGEPRPPARWLGRSP